MSAEIGKQILDAVKAYVNAQVQPLRESLAMAHAQLIGIQPAAKGEPGERGEKGDPGPVGPAPTDDELIALITPLIPAPVKGEPGEKGEKGEKGEPGAKGDPGEHATPPTEEQLRALIAPLIPQPARGEPGEKGERGEKGEPGKDAAAPSEDVLRAIITPLIPAPVQGETGPRGERGEQGATPTADELRALIVPLIPAPVCGEKGEPGKDGEPGRDALALEILPAIDEVRSYPRGTYARHAGGLWRSFETTHALRGWECLVEGIARETETMSEDGRTLVRTTVYSSGREFSREFRFSTVLDRGVYKSEHTYAPGDAVTWAGSVWIAQKLEGNGVVAPAYGKPGTAGSGWRLAVKAGRDART